MGKEFYRFQVISIFLGAIFNLIIALNFEGNIWWVLFAIWCGSGLFLKKLWKVIFNEDVSFLKAI